MTAESIDFLLEGRLAPEQAFGDRPHHMTRNASALPTSLGKQTVEHAPHCWVIEAMHALLIEHASQAFGARGTNCFRDRRREFGPHRLEPRYVHT